MTLTTLRISNADTVKTCPVNAEMSPIKNAQWMVIRPCKGFRD